MRWIDIEIARLMAELHRRENLETIMMAEYGWLKVIL